MTEVQVDVSPGDEVSDIIDNVQAGELLVFPSGTFQWSSAVQHIGRTDFGIRCQSDTVFEIPAGWGDSTQLGTQQILDLSDCDNFLLENLTFDSPGRAAPGMKLQCDTAGHVKNLHYACDGPLSHDAHDFGMVPYVSDPNGLLLIENYRQHNNGDIGGYGSGDSRGAVWTGRAHEGHIYFSNPVLSGFPNNIFYTGRTTGQITIEDGFLANSNVSAVRCSGTTTVRNTTVYMDIDTYMDGPGTLNEGAHNFRAFWGETGGGVGEPGGTIENCDVVVESLWYSSSLFNIEDAEYMDISGTQVLLDSENLNIRDGVVVDHDSVESTLENCRFDGVDTEVPLGDGPLGGSNIYANPDMNHGTLPVTSTTDYAFDWSTVHPETPGYTGDSTDSGTTNESPQADITTQIDGLTVTFDGSGSTDSDGSIAAYDWSIDGQSYTGESVSVTFDSGGTYAADLTVTDDDGATASTTASVTVEDVARVAYNDDATAVTASHYDGSKRAGVEFSLTNLTDQELSVATVTVTPHDSAINMLDDESNEIGAFVSELYVDADTQAGVCDVPGSTEIPRTFDLANDGWSDSADRVAVMSAGSAATVSVGRFEDDETPVDMPGEQIDVTVGYQLANGTSGTDSFTLSVSEPASPPAIDQYEVTEAGSKNPHANIMADWTVSDGDGDLASVTVEVIDGNDSVVDSAKTSVSGAEAYDVDYFELKHVDGQTFDVRLTVTDSAGETVSATRTVSE
ncbi:PKD domain-containing protein [Halosimplex amylolyticum]|uniref:PKD domain-containing protein n=1 Tax=Halosimplex amylolyticum TaxID=3396616 RepID=UPI003F56AE76